MNSDDPAADPVTIRENKLTLVERLADDLAHEIKNPLHSMVINLEVLRRRLARLETEQSQELLYYTAIINVELERVNRRVDLLLQMVRPNREGEDWATLAEVLDEMSELVQLECERQGVQLEMDIPVTFVRSSLPRASTRQVILSLVLKTLDSVPTGGSLHLATECTPDSLRILIYGLDSNGAVTAPAPSLHDGSDLAVAGTLAARIGGTFEVLSSSNGAGSGFVEARGKFLLSLPRDV